MSHVVINYLKPGRGGSNHRDPCYFKKDLFLGPIHDSLSKPFIKCLLCNKELVLNYAVPTFVLSHYVTLDLQ